ncbi:unnamed protein product [Thlaspi arvense]|uniref:Uncharacterized protein n=1 Tax=Thlaspi arvense TaxID=13288 RepID=A0AAU9S499_THLAR|nr:unnamed protein product [Thlaspi arvense]
MLSNKQPLKVNLDEGSQGAIATFNELKLITDQEQEPINDLGSSRLSFRLVKAMTDMDRPGSCYEVNFLWPSSVNHNYCCCIYRVPCGLRGVNPEAYTPRMLLIGPIHHFKKAQAAELSKPYLRSKMLLDLGPIMVTHFTDMRRLDRVETLGLTKEEQINSKFVSMESRAILRNADIKRVVRNTMALEQFHYTYTAYVCHYIDFLDCLIETEKDADLLVNAGVIKNLLGRKGLLADMVNKLSLEVVDYGNYYYDITESLSDHYDRKLFQQIRGHSPASLLQRRLDRNRSHRRRHSPLVNFDWDSSFRSPSGQ